jgi:hypothetical protein
MVINMTEENMQGDVELSEEPKVEEEGVTVANETAEPLPVQEDVTAEVVNIQQGGAQNVTADKITVSQGGIAHAEGRFIDVSEGGIAAAIGENVTLTEGAAFVVAAENVKMSDSIAVFVAANEISGDNVRVIIDVKAAAFFALIFGAIAGVMKVLLRRRD